MHPNSCWQRQKSHETRAGNGFKKRTKPSKVTPFAIPLCWYRTSPYGAIRHRSLTAQKPFLKIGVLSYFTSCRCRLWTSRSIFFGLAKVVPFGLILLRRLNLLRRVSRRCRNEIQARMGWLTNVLADAHHSLRRLQITEPGMLILQREY